MIHESTYTTRSRPTSYRFPFQQTKKERMKQFARIYLLTRAIFDVAPYPKIQHS